MPKKHRKTDNERRSHNVRRYVVGAVALVVVAAISGFFLWPKNDGVSSASGGFVAQAATLGQDSAPVLIEEYADFQCTACRYLNTTVMPQLITEFIDTGKVRLAYRHFAIFGQESFWAGMAAECANEQSQFWAYHDVLFEVQGSPNSGVFSRTQLKGYAASLGLDAEAFGSCLDSDRYLARVKSDSAEAKSRGGTGTPTLFINGRKLGGVPSIETFRQLIQTELDG